MTIALLTDFGLRDSYVGVMKAVMRGIHPAAEFIDITHDIQPQQVREAAFVLMGAYAYFPHGTVFVVVVDPGVGSERRPIAVETDSCYFVAPDNGVLSYVLQGVPIKRIAELANPDFRLRSVSQTFHGRDIFAPAAAHLSAGVSIEQFGPSLDTINMLPAPRLSIEDSCMLGEVIHIDHFGNVITSVGTWVWQDDHMLHLKPRFGIETTERVIPANAVEVKIRHQHVRGISRTYSSAETGSLLALIGSSGFLELAVNQGSGAALLNAEIGDLVELRW